MSVLLSLTTQDFEFSIWSSDITKRQAVYQETLIKRGHCQNQGALLEQQSFPICFSPALQIQDLEIENVTIQLDKNEKTAEIKLVPYLFFENVQYQFEWIFFNKVYSAQLAHKDQLLNDCFRFIAAHREMPARIIGTINTGNNVGWMCLPIEYQIDGKIFKQEVSFEVLPTKMNLHTDLPAMYEAIDRVFPLWRFSLVNKTEQNVGKGQNRGHFPLMWLANFAQLRERFEQGLKVIAQAPHSRLQTHSSYIKADRVKGKIKYRTGLRIKENLLTGCLDKRYRIDTKKLSVDTPENRLIKLVIITCKKSLLIFENALRVSNQKLERQRLSDAFLDELHQWQQPLQKILAHTFFKDVGPFTGLSKESLVLQQKTGYSTVYRVWQDLKFYLDIFGNISNISMKSVAEIYEVWCFLTLKNILLDELKFEEITTTKNILELNTFFEYQLKDGFAGAFEFKRIDGVKARLAHEPKFTKKGVKIRSFLVPQEPDILLEIELPTGQKFIWIFDAKYRIKTQQNRFDDENINSVDYVPDDAINQMHRYRDALVRLTAENTSKSNLYSKSRPVFGAFALYPGYFDQENTSNPYKDAISETGVGAFALLPNSIGSKATGSQWLKEYLIENIGEISIDRDISNSWNGKMYLQDSSRIPIDGMKQVFYTDLVAIIPLNKRLVGSSIHYTNHAEVKDFLFPLELLSNNINISKEIKYLCFVEGDSSKLSSLGIDKIWPIEHVNFISQSMQLENECKGMTQISCVFKLGHPLVLFQKISCVAEEALSYRIQLTTLGFLTKATQFSKIKSVYETKTA
ncbi:DUF2357 domain-containing protein [Acinetobacter tandoii]|nr:DUF2357 domain-containing protein [Acinetobacter tandoii]